jgi:hypothetical protein
MSSMLAIVVVRDVGDVLADDGLVLCLLIALAIIARLVWRLTSRD